jgi:hypothetical protein
MILDELTNHITDIIHTGNPAQRKALIEALVAEVKITGPHTIIPVFRIPQPPATNDTITENTEAVAAPPATTASERVVHTMVEPVELLTAYSHTTQAADLHICLLAATRNRRPRAELTTTTPWSLRERLPDDMIQAMACAYRTGATSHDLAIAHDLSLSSVKRLLRTAGVRRTPPTRQSEKAMPAAPHP